MALKVSELNNSYPHNCPTLNAVRTLYADWNAILDKRLGYIRYYLQLDGRQVMLYEHQLVAQAAYGEIPEGYHVHHMNKQRVDNRAENLQVLSAEEHATLHANFRSLAFRSTGIPKCEHQFVCDHCGKTFRRAPTQHKHIYCSVACMSIALRKVTERPTAEALSAMLCTSSYKAIGRQFGVSDNAVRKWARQYGLIKHPRQESDLRHLA